MKTWQETRIKAKNLQHNGYSAEESHRLVKKLYGLHDAEKKIMDPLLAQFIGCAEEIRDHLLELEEWQYEEVGKESLPSTCPSCGQETEEVVYWMEGVKTLCFRCHKGWIWWDQ